MGAFLFQSANDPNFALEIRGWDVGTVVLQASTQVIRMQQQQLLAAQAMSAVFVMFRGELS